MEAHGARPGVARSEPLSSRRQRTISCDIFWNLMDRWKVPTDRALTLIGYDPEPIDIAQRRSFALSDEQAKIVSCLLEIDLTLAVASVHDRRHRRRKASALVTGDLPLDAMGRCDLTRAAAVLWSLNRTGGAKWRSCPERDDERGFP